MAKDEIKQFDDPKIKEIIKDINKEYFSSTNIFEILHQESYETKHSTFLGWLLNPLASHGLGTEFAQKFFEKLDENKEKTNEKKIDFSKIKEVVLEKRTDGKEQAKEGKDRKRIDILLIGNDFTCTIENKYGSGIHDNQCQNYRKFINDTYKNKTNRFIFLDIIEPKDFKTNPEYDAYEFIQYTDIIGILENILENHSFDENHKLQRQFIVQYKEILDKRYSANFKSSKFYKLCNKMSLKEILQIYNIDDKNLEYLEADQKRFVEVIRDYYSIKKKETDDKIDSCLKAICKDKYFFKNDYGNKKQMYANCIPIILDCINIEDYLCEEFYLSEDNEPKRNEIQITKEQKEKYLEFKSKKVKELSSDEQKERKLINKKIENAKEIIEQDKDINNRTKTNIPFQTIDYRAPDTESNDIRIMIYAGLVPCYSRYMCKENVFDAQKLLALENEGWTIEVKFYIKNPAGFKIMKEDGKEAIFNLTINKNNSRELKEVYRKGEKILGKEILIKDVSNNGHMKKYLEDYLGFVEKKSKDTINNKKLVEFLKESKKLQEWNKKPNNSITFGCEIILQYEIKEDDWSETKLKNIFYEKSIEGASVFGYDDWFKNIIFKNKSNWD